MLILGTQSEVRFDAENHRYWLGPRELKSVSAVIRTVYSPKSWDGVDPDVVDRARVRGEAVDKYLSAYIANGNVVVPYGESDDVKERFEIAARLWDKAYPNGIAVQVQPIVYSEEDGIAGTADFIVDGETVVDLKNTYRPEHSWKLQIGAYSAYSGARNARVLHVSPKVHPGGGVWLPYNVVDCKAIWQDAVKWYKRTLEMEHA